MEVSLYINSPPPSLPTTTHCMNELWYLFCDIYYATLRGIGRTLIKISVILDTLSRLAFCPASELRG